VECEAEDVIEDLPVLPLFVVADPVCLAVPEEPVAEPVFEFVFEFVLSAVFVADGLDVCAAAEVSVYHLSICRGKDWERLVVENALTVIAVGVLPYNQRVQFR
jgi:hypothetical protein